MKTFKEDTADIDNAIKQANDFLKIAATFNDFINISHSLKELYDLKYRLLISNDITDL